MKVSSQILTVGPNHLSEDVDQTQEYAAFANAHDNTEDLVITAEQVLVPGEVVVILKGGKAFSELINTIDKVGNLSGFSLDKHIKLMIASAVEQQVEDQLRMTPLGKDITDCIQRFLKEDSLA